MAKRKCCGNCGEIVWFNEDDVDIFATDEFKSKSKMEKVAYLYEKRLYAEMERRLLKEIKKGNAEAMLYLSNFNYRQGNADCYWKYLKMAANTNNSKALELLGDHYAESLDPEKAKIYYDQAKSNTQN